jgi:alginate O-acetyltransferase complex protein AlgI
MIYSSPEFIILIALALAAYSMARSYRLRFSILLAASAIFYSWAGRLDSLVFFLVILFSWSVVFLSERYPRAKGWLVSFGIAAITLHLLFWKYTPWIASQVQGAHQGFLGGREWLLPLPLGISFFTLQSIAYLTDYYHGDAAFVSFPVYALFKSFFGQLIAGPIVRASQLFPQLERLERPKPAEVSLGLSLFVFGFIKKVGVADRVAFFVDLVFSAPQNFGRLVLLKALLGYAVQIWADFSGYIDMGRGAALMFGIHLPENFLSPYFARSPSEFWMRWHITLSQWIRDYLFTPLALAGRRLSEHGAFFGVVLTMFIAGLWHGAGWNYVIFGLYHGLLLVLERKFRFRWPGLDAVPWLARAREVLKGLFMFCLVLGGWLIFRSESLRGVGSFLRGLAFDTGGLPGQAKGRSIYIGLAFCFLTQALSYYDLREERWLVLAPLKERVSRIVERLEVRSSALLSLGGFCVGAGLAALLIGTILMRPPQGKAFIYFQF